MSVDTTHNKYNKALPVWAKVRPAIEGEEAVKLQRQKILPDMGMEPAAYDAYLQRASYFNAVGTTHAILVGMVFDKDPTVSVDGKQIDEEQMSMSVTMSGATIDELAKNVVSEQLSVSRLGLLTALPEGELQDVSPYIALYKAESITNWKTVAVTGVEYLAMVVLRETYDVPKENDLFDLQPKIQYRVLLMVDASITEDDLMGTPASLLPALQAPPGIIGDKEAPSTIAAKLAVIICRETKAPAKKENKWVVVSATIPEIRGEGRYIREIPFVVCNLYSTDINKIDDPYLLDQVNINLSHFRTSADLEHGRHFTGLPQPCTAGFDVPQGSVLTIGSGNAWNAENADAKAWYLEFEGKGLQSLETALEQKAKQLAVLGTRSIEEPKKAVEATDTHRLRRAGEETSLTSAVSTAEEALSKALTWFLKWEEMIEGNVSVHLNKDYTRIAVTDAFLKAMNELHKTGGCSFETLYYNFSIRDVYPDNWNIDKERELIANEGMEMMKRQNALIEE